MFDFSRTGYNIGTIFGVPIRLDISLIILAAFYIIRAGLINGLLITVALVAAILVHELGHAIAMKAFNCKVRDITIMFFGGAATTYNMPKAPWKDAVISLAGPVAGLVLWAIIPFIAQLIPIKIIALLLAQIAFISLWLSLFNLIPAYPLDGGHVLRAALTSYKGKIEGARISCKVAYGIAALMGLYGLSHLDAFMIIIAFFIWSSARSELAALSHFQTYDDDDDDVIISPPPYGGDRDYTKLNRKR